MRTDGHKQPASIAPQLPASGWLAPFASRASGDGHPPLAEIAFVGFGAGKLALNTRVQRAV
jgi:hypothetical protein